MLTILIDKNRTFLLKGGKIVFKMNMKEYKKNSCVFIFYSFKS